MKSSGFVFILATFGLIYSSIPLTSVNTPSAPWTLSQIEMLEKASGSRDPATTADESFPDISFADSDCGPSVPVLYRCVTNGFFTGLRVIQNMLGDERAEHPSWALTAILRSHQWDPQNLQQYRDAKALLQETFRQARAQDASWCQDLNRNSMHVTAGMEGKFSKSQSALSILASDGIPYAHIYCLYDPKSVFLVMSNQQARAAFSHKGFAPHQGMEYGIPGFIRWQDLTAAATNDLRIEKQTSTTGTRISVFARTETGFSPSTNSLSRDGKRLFDIESCPSRCETRPSVLKKAENFIPGLGQALEEAAARETYFQINE